MKYMVYISEKILSFPKLYSHFTLLKILKKFNDDY